MLFNKQLNQAQICWWDEGEERSRAERHVGGGEDGACNVVSPWFQFREKLHLGWLSPYVIGGKNITTNNKNPNNLLSCQSCSIVKTEQKWMAEFCPVANWPEGNRSAVSTRDAAKNSHVNLEKDLTIACQIPSALADPQTGLGTKIIIASAIYRMGFL